MNNKKQVTIEDLAKGECPCSICASQDVNERLGQFANLLIDKVLEDKAKGTLRFQVKVITITIEAKGFIVR